MVYNVKKTRGAMPVICEVCGTEVVDKERCPVCGNVLQERVVLFTDSMSMTELDRIENSAHREQIVKMSILTFVLAGVVVLVSLLFLTGEFKLPSVLAGTALSLVSLTLAFMTSSIARRMRMKLRRTYVATAVSCSAVAWCVFAVIMSVLGI